MKQFLLIFFLISSSALWANSDDDLLKKADSLASYMDSDFQAEYKIIQSKPGQNDSVTVAGVFRRDSKEQYVILIMEPSVSKGQGYLKEGDMLWFYDPESREFNSTASRERFQNSNARNSDFTRSTLSLDYMAVSGKDEKLGRFNCRVIELEAKTKDLAYPKMKIWISDDGLVRKTEDYSLSGQLLRTTAFPDYYTIGRKYVPKAILIIDALRGSKINDKFVNEKTQILIKDASFKKIDNSVFSKAFLEYAHNGL